MVKLHFVLGKLGTLLPYKGEKHNTQPCSSERHEPRYEMKEIDRVGHITQKCSHRFSFCPDKDSWIGIR